MIGTLLDSPFLLASAIVLVGLLNYGIGLQIIRAHSRQPFVERDDWSPPGIAGKPRSDAARLALPFIGIVGAAALILFVDRMTREIIGGGFLVMELATTSSSVADLLAVGSLRRSDAASGHIRYSAVYRFRVGAARTIGTAIVCGAVAILFNSKAFLFGTLFLLATAAGWYRRAHQASRRAPGLG